MKIEFTLNGQPRSLEAPASRRVVDLLRADLRLTGTKESCRSGECGACSILVDGESRLSCLMVAAQLAGRQVTTIEGVAADPTHAGLLAAFVQHGAVQCGYCSPGMVISAVDLLRRQPQPSRSEIRVALSGNLCRCTGYQKIVDAVAAAAEVGRALPPGVAPQPGGLVAPESPARDSSPPSAGDPGEAEVLLPATARELLELAGTTGSARLLAGGTDLFVAGRGSSPSPRVWIGLERVPELKAISAAGDELVIGAAATLEQIVQAAPVRQHLPLLLRAIAVLGSPPIRHMATLGGNLCTASPAADSWPALQVLGARVELRSLHQRRVLPLAGFITGPGKNELQSGEILWSVRVPLPATGMQGAYFKVGRRQAMAIAVASLAAAWRQRPDGTIDQVRLAWGSVGPTVLVFPEIESALEGQRWSLETLKRLAGRVASLVKPIDEVRASASYRRQVAGNLLLKLLEEPQTA